MTQRFTWTVGCGGAHLEEAFTEALKEASRRFSPRCLLEYANLGDVRAMLTDGRGRVIASALFSAGEDEVSWKAEPTFGEVLSPWFECALGEDALSRLTGVEGFRLDGDEPRDVPDFHVRYPTPSDFARAMTGHTAIGRALEAASTVGTAINRMLGLGEGYRWLNTELPPARDAASSPSPDMR